MTNKIFELELFLSKFIEISHIDFFTLPLNVCKKFLRDLNYTRRNFNFSIYRYHAHGFTTTPLTHNFVSIQISIQLIQSVLINVYPSCPIYTFLKFLSYLMHFYENTQFSSDTHFGFFQTYIEIYTVNVSLFNSILLFDLSNYTLLFCKWTN